MNDWPIQFPRLVGGISYAADRFGIIHQLNPDEFIYDREYVASRYDTYPPEQLASMAYLRLGLLAGVVGDDYSASPRLLDWGYGNGAFLRAAMNLPGWSAHGHEINGYGVPAGCHEESSPYRTTWDVVTMFDVLEHLKNPLELTMLKTRWLLLTVPFCHARDRGLDWFSEWKHRRVHEHITNWDADAIESFLSFLGYDVFYLGSPEDTIRKPEGGWSNTLTVIARKIEM